MDLDSKIQTPTYVYSKYIQMLYFHRTSSSSSHQDLEETTYTNLTSWPNWNSSTLLPLHILKICSNEINRLLES